MISEAAGAVVVLSVDVATDRAADGYLAGSGQYRDPQSGRQGRSHQLIQADSAVDVDHACPGVDRVNPIQCGHVDDQSAAVLGVVAVGAAQSARDDPAMPAFGGLGGHPGDDFDDLLGIRGVEHLGDTG